MAVPNSKLNHGLRSLRLICYPSKTVAILFCELVISAAVLEPADIVIVATNHSSVDYKNVVEKSALILDTRNATREINSLIRNEWFYCNAQ